MSLTTLPLALYTNSALFSIFFRHHETFILFSVLCIPYEFRNFFEEEKSNSCSYDHASFRFFPMFPWNFSRKQVHVTFSRGEHLYLHLSSFRGKIAGISSMSDSSNLSHCFLAIPQAARLLWVEELDLSQCCRRIYSDSPHSSSPASSTSKQHVDKYRVFGLDVRVLGFFSHYCSILSAVLEFFVSVTHPGILEVSGLSYFGYNHTNEIFLAVNPDILRLRKKPPRFLINSAELVFFWNFTHYCLP